LTDLVVQYLSTDAIYRTTLRNPYPYSDEDSVWFINFNKEYQAEHGYPSNFAVRNKSKDNELIGVCGIVAVENRTAEIGYWIAEEYWGQGLMTPCVKALMDIGGYIFTG
jgi:ribosomal-protein-alanine N-acetyltransferase